MPGDESDSDGLSSQGAGEAVADKEIPQGHGGSPIHLHPAATEASCAAELSAPAHAGCASPPFPGGHASGWFHKALGVQSGPVDPGSSQRCSQVSDHCRSAEDAGANQAERSPQLFVDESLSPASSTLGAATPFALPGSFAQDSDNCRVAGAVPRGCSRSVRCAFLLLFSSEVRSCQHWQNSVPVPAAYAKGRRRRSQA